MPKDKLMRYAKILRIVGMLVIVALLAFIGYQLWVFYGDKVGYTAPKAINDYFSALAQGDHDAVLAATARDRLVDLYGRPVTEAEFDRQLERVTGGRKLPFQEIEVEEIGSRGASRFYRVTLTSSVGGATGESRLLVEVRRQGRGWVITYPFAIVL